MAKCEDKKAMFDEAVARMKILKLHENPIKEFKKEGKLNYSDFQGYLFWLEEDTASRVPKEVFDALHSFEERTGCLVYHVVQSFTEVGTMWSFLYVGKDTDEWAFEREDLENGLLYAYVYNSTYPELSELGSIMVKPRWGGLIRTT